MSINIGKKKQKNERNLYKFKHKKELQKICNSFYVKHVLKMDIISII